MPFSVKSQNLTTICGLENCRELLKMTSSKIDSLKNKGIKQIINFSQYKTGCEGGYSKIIWVENEKLKGICFKINQIKDNLAQSEYSSLNNIDTILIERALNSKQIFESRDFDKVYNNRKPKQSLFLLYFLNNSKSDCINISQSERKYHRDDISIQIIESLEMDYSEFRQLILNDKKRKLKKNK